MEMAPGNGNDILPVGKGSSRQVHSSLLYKMLQHVIRDGKDDQHRKGWASFLSPCSPCFTALSECIYFSIFGDNQVWLVRGPRGTGQMLSLGPLCHAEGCSDLYIQQHTCCFSFRFTLFDTNNRWHL